MRGYHTACAALRGILPAPDVILVQARCGAASPTLPHPRGSPVHDRSKLLRSTLSLAAVLIQSERFGTSVAGALRGLSESVRVRRRQMAFGGWLSDAPWSGGISASVHCSEDFHPEHAGSVRSARRIDTPSCYAARSEVTHQHPGGRSFLRGRAA